ncbi:MAG: phage holin family protein [Balneolaceae bacterium]|nr:phage holin family protein [Balneolaceae bacterium]
MADDGTADRIGQRIKHITVDLKRYVEKRIELMVINVGEQYARWIAESIQKIAGLIFLFGALVFLLIALALYLGELLNSRSLGFVLVSIPFLICGYLFFNLKPASISRKLRTEFEEELIGIFKVENIQKDDKLIPPESNELEKKNEHHG